MHNLSLDGRTIEISPKKEERVNGWSFLQTALDMLRGVVLLSGRMPSGLAFSALSARAPRGCTRALRHQGVLRVHGRYLHSSEKSSQFDMYM